MFNLATVLGILTLTSPVLANVTLIQDDRMILAGTSLTLDLNEPGGPVTDDDLANFVPEFGTDMNNQVSSVLIGHNQNQTVQYASLATQQSSISSNSLHALLSVETDATGFAHGYSGRAFATSLFDVSFTLSKQMEYTFELLNIAGMNFDPGNPYHAKLMDDQGNVISGFFRVGAESGTLEAGEYRMVVASTNFYETDHSFEPVKSIEARLTFVPSPSSILSLGLIGILTSRRRSEQKPS